MTPQEFKAWFDGFTEAIDGQPSKKQWERIKARVSEIDGNPITERIYIDRYWPIYHRPYSYVRPMTYTTWSNGTPTISASVATGTFNSSSAMYALGKADYTSQQ